MESATATRPVSITRETGVFRLAFDYSEDLVERVKKLAGARFDGESRSWTALVCTQNIDGLREWFGQGLTDVAVDDLIESGEKVPTVAAATLRAGSTARPFLVDITIRNDTLYNRLRAISGAAWDSKNALLSYPASAAAALSELVDRDVIADPERLMSPGDVVVAFDVRSGWFSVRGDERAASSFAKSFPRHDVFDVWTQRGIDVAFADDLTEASYRSELARNGEGLQPDGITKNLFLHQRQSVAMAVCRSGLAVFAEMGAGKTAIAIAAGHELQANRRETTRTVVVVPGAVRTQWRNEIMRFVDCDEQDIVVIEGSKKKRTEAYERALDAQWVIVHYDVVGTDLAELMPVVRGCTLVADEAHRLKSPTAKRTKAMRTLARKASHRIALSGTPVENDPGEWYSVVSGFVEPGCFGSPAEFLNRYAFKGRFGGWEGARNLDELHLRSRTYYVRHRKSEVAKHLPPLRVAHKPLDLDATHAAALKRAHRDARDEISASAVERISKASRYAGVLDGTLIDDAKAGASMTAVGMLKMLTLSPRLLWMSEAPSAKALCDAGLVPETDGPKLDELRVKLAELQAQNQRVVVFTESQKMTQLVSQRCDEDGIRHVTYTGKTSRADRDAAVEAFTTASDENNLGPTMFLATDAGGEGLNLGAQCSLLINLDVPWTPGRLGQRSARIHRIDGTAPSYLVINFTLRGTIEEGFLKLVERKADLQDAIFGEEGGRARSTGRRGSRNIFEQALEAWMESDNAKAR